MPIDLRQFVDKPSEKVDQHEEQSPDLTENYHQETAFNQEKKLHQWEAPEFEVYEKSTRWFLLAGLFLLAIITYAMYTNGPIMAITFILVGIVGYIHLQKEPRLVTFSITNSGIIADKDLYLFENIHSFWIFYDPAHTKLISLHTKASVFPYVHIPLGDEDPVHIRELILAFVPEIKQEPGIVDTIEKVLHI